MSFIKSVLAAVVGSVAANLVVLFALRAAVIDPAMPLHALSVGPVAMLTVIGVVGAVVVYAVMRALMTNPNTVFIWLSLVVLVVSFVPDYLIIGKTTGPFAGGTVGSAAVLALMHVVAAVIAVWSLVKIWGAKKVSPTA